MAVFNCIETNCLESTNASLCMTDDGTDATLDLTGIPGDMYWNVPGDIYMRTATLHVQDTPGVNGVWIAGSGTPNVTSTDGTEIILGSSGVYPVLGRNLQGVNGQSTAMTFESYAKNISSPSVILNGSFKFIPLDSASLYHTRWSNISDITLMELDAIGTQLKLGAGLASNIAFTFDDGTDRNLTWVDAKGYFDFSENVHLNDSLQLIFGTGDDATIEWNNANSFLEVNGNVEFIDGWNLPITSSSGSDAGATITHNGNVTLNSLVAPVIQAANIGVGGSDAFEFASKMEATGGDSTAFRWNYNESTEPTNPTNLLEWGESRDSGNTGAMDTIAMRMDNLGNLYIKPDNATPMNFTSAEMPVAGLGPSGAHTRADTTQTFDNGLGFPFCIFADGIIVTDNPDIHFNIGLTRTISHNGSNFTMTQGLLLGGDNRNIIFGAASDADIGWDGTNLVLDSTLVSAGQVNIVGDILNTTGVLESGVANSGTNVGHSIEMDSQWTETGFTNGDFDTGDMPRLFTVFNDRIGDSPAANLRDQRERFSVFPHGYVTASGGLFIGADPIDTLTDLNVVRVVKDFVNNSTDNKRSTDLLIARTMTSGSASNNLTGVVCEVRETSRNATIGGVFTGGSFSAVHTPSAAFTAAHTFDLVGGSFSTRLNAGSRNVGTSSYDRFIGAQFQVDEGANTGSTHTIGTMAHMELITGAGATVQGTKTNSYGIWMNVDLTNAVHNATNVDAIRIESQTTNGAAAKGNLNFIGGDWNTGHLSFGDNSGHIWATSGDIRFKDSAPSSATDYICQVQASGFELADGSDIIVATSGTGSAIGTAATALIGFWGATPIVQPAGANQAALTNSTGGSYDGTLAAISGSGDDANINNNFTDLHTLLDEIRTALVGAGIMKGAA